jgi:hypothetical protein
MEDNMIHKAKEHHDIPGRGRSGTVYLTKEEFAKVFGPPQYTCTEPDVKVTFIHTFYTAQGLVHVRDYWWNPETELSISAETVPAQAILHMLLNEHGIKHS